jgi:hypothetical protein
VAFRDSIQHIVSYFRKNTSDVYEQEMRRQDMMEALKNFAPLAVVGVVVLLGSLGGYSYWSYRKDVRLFRSELLYDQYIRDLQEDRVAEAKKKHAQLVKTHEMKKLLKIESAMVSTKDFRDHVQPQKKAKYAQWKKLCETYEALDATLFAKSRHQTALYSLTQFILAATALDFGVEDPKMRKEIEGYALTPGAFSGLAHALQVSHAIQSKKLTVDMLSAWQKISQTWIVFACALGAQLSISQDKLK